MALVNEACWTAGLFVLLVACAGGEEAGQIPDLVPAQVASEMPESEPCPLEDLGWIRDPVFGRASEDSEESWMTIEWELELGICPADLERMTREDLRALRDSLRSQITAFGWNLVALRSDEGSKTMFIEELNGRLEWVPVQDLRVQYIRVWE